MRLAQPKLSPRTLGKASSRYFGIKCARARVFSNRDDTKGLFEIPAGTLAQARRSNGPANRQPLLAAFRGEWDTCRARAGLGGFAIITASDPKIYLNPSFHL